MNLSLVAFQNWWYVALRREEMESCTVLQFKGMEGREKVNVEVD